jgi:hypothetical protein
MGKNTLLGILGLSLALLTLPAPAQPPRELNFGAGSPPPGAGLNNLVEQPTAKEEVNPAYAVSPEAGPWMICAASYQGSDAPELANMLCEFLRSRGYRAYIYNRGNEERKKWQEELDRWQQAHPGMVRKWRLANMQEEQLAVLIGGFRDPDAAGSELKKLRKLEVPLMKLKSGKPAFDTYDVYEQTPGTKNYELKRYPISPIHNAMAVPNPTIPHQHQAGHKPDPVWKKLNADEPFSLYKCPKPWTLAVQEYAGAQVIQPTSASSGFLDKFGLGEHNLGKRLDAAAMQAQQVCGLLRKFNYKAYVLHTRNSSVVTVGEFSSPNDPELLRVQQELTKFSFKDKMGNDIVKLFARPLPMEVPH